MRRLSFKRYRFPPDVIRHTVWLYARFTLSFRADIVVGIHNLPESGRSHASQTFHGGEDVSIRPCTLRYSDSVGWAAFRVFIP